MKFDDVGLSSAFKAEANRIEVPHRPRRQGSSRLAPIGRLAVALVVVAASLVVGRTLAEFRTAASVVSSSASPSGTTRPSGGIISGRYGVISDGKPPTVVSETRASIATLRGEFFHGAVSPDGRKIAYWETYGAPTARSLWLLEIGSSTPQTPLLTLADAETASISSGNAVVWSSDGSGLLIAVQSVATAGSPGLPDAPPLYSALRQVVVANASVQEIMRMQGRGAWFSPVAWDRARAIATAATVGVGGFAATYVVVRNGVAPIEAPLPTQTLTLAGYLQANSDATAVLMRGFPDHHELYVWPLAEPTQVQTLKPGADEYVARAIWRNPREIVVSLSRTTASDVADRLEIWTVGGARRIVISTAHRLDAVRPDGSAAYTDSGVVDLVTGGFEPAASNGRVLAAVQLQ